MATSNAGATPGRGPFAELAIALAWGAWSELGISGWTETHGDWAIDPEPLIVFTALLDDGDPRLRDEATDWCIRNWRYVSKARLKNTVRSWPRFDREAFGEFAATVGEHAGITWPGSTEPRPYTPTGRSVLPPLDRPSLVWLRLRAMFGLGARTEILRYFLAGPPMRAGVAEIAAVTGYTKRNIAEESDQLKRAGVLDVRQNGNRYSYGLARRSELEAFVGEFPPLRPDWNALLRVASELVALERQVATSSPRTLPVKVRAALTRIEGDLHTLDVLVPSAGIVGASLWPAVESLASATLGEWSIGHWPNGGPGRLSLSATLAEMRDAERY